MRREENSMSLNHKKLLPPPWLAYPEIERYSIGWRMGGTAKIIYINSQIGFIRFRKRSKKSTVICSLNQSHGQAGGMIQTIQIY